VVVLRISYPLGFYAKGFDGPYFRAESGRTPGPLDRTPWLRKGRKGSLPIVVHFQNVSTSLAHGRERAVETRRPGPTVMRHAFGSPLIQIPSVISH